MSLVIPVKSVPNQAVTVQLANQATQVNIFQQLYGLYMSVFLAGEPVVQGVICQNLNRIVRSLYLGFEGDFVWLDTQGAADPIFTGIGARWQLVYLSTADLAGEG